MTTAPASLRADVSTRPDRPGCSPAIRCAPMRRPGGGLPAAGRSRLLIDRAEAAALAGYFDRADRAISTGCSGRPDPVDALSIAPRPIAPSTASTRAADIDAPLYRRPQSGVGPARARQYPPAEGQYRRGRPPRLAEGSAEIAPGTPEDIAARANLEHLAERRHRRPDGRPDRHGARRPASGPCRTRRAGRRGVLIRAGGLAAGDRRRAAGPEPGRRRGPRAAPLGGGEGHLLRGRRSRPRKSPATPPSPRSCLRRHAVVVPRERYEMAGHEPRRAGRRRLWSGRHRSPTSRSKISPARP